MVKHKHLKILVKRGEYFIQDKKFYKELTAVHHVLLSFALSKI